MAASACSRTGHSAPGTTPAQSYPSRPIETIVPYPAGGAVDIIAGSIGQPLGEALKQPVIVGNRSGGEREHRHGDGSQGGAGRLRPADGFERHRDQHGAVPEPRPRRSSRFRCDCQDRRRSADEIPVNANRRSFLQLAATSLAILSGCASVSSTPDRASIEALAPSGTLRVGLYPDAPTSIVGDLKSGNAKGVGLDLGRELAKRAGVPFESVVFPNNAAVLAAAKSGAVDMVFTNATPTRMNDLDFSPTVLHVELGYLVPAGSAIREIGEIDRPGVRVGVSEGSTSEATLSRELRNAIVVTTPSLKAAIDMLAAGTLNAFATNKATLFEMSDRLPGSRVLAGRWGLERFAIGVPKGREAAMPLVSNFVTEVKANGQLARAVEQAGLRGSVLAN